MNAKPKSVTDGDLSDSSSQPISFAEKCVSDSVPARYSTISTSQSGVQPTDSISAEAEHAESSSETCVQLYHHTRAINLRDIIRDRMITRTDAYLRYQDRATDPRAVHLSSDPDAARAIPYEVRLAELFRVPWWGNKTLCTVVLDIPASLIREPDYDKGNVYRWRRWAICRQWDKQWWLKSMDMRGADKWWVAERDLPMSLFARILVGGETIWKAGDSLDALLLWAEQVDAESGGRRSHMVRPVTFGGRNVRI